jgi:predicted transcriptional regulator of viral defense system
MSNQTSIEKLILSSKPVVTIDDLAVIWQKPDRRQLVELVKYYARQGRINPIYKGVYAYGNYTMLDVAQKLVPLSYLSLYTTAQMHGLTFQNYSTIFCIALSSKKYHLKGQTFEYHKVKEQIFYNPLGLEYDGKNTVAGKERTMGDLMYVYPNIAFDNLNNVDTVLLSKISRIYKNRRVERDITKLIKQIEDR